MIKAFLAFLFCLGSLLTVAQYKVLLFGDIRYDDPGYTPFRYRETTSTQLTSLDRKDSFKVVDLVREKKYDRPGGTRILFEVPVSLYNKVKSTLPSKKLRMRCVFTYPKRVEDKVQTSSEVFLEADLSDADELRSGAVSLGAPILLSAPERLTLTMMMNDIDDDLGDNKQGGYSRATRLLDDNFERYNTQGLEYTTALDMYNLLSYIDRYVQDNSFFNQEAKRLKDTIDHMSRLLQSKTGNKTVEQSLLQEFIDSTEVYEDYLRVYGRLKDYYSRLKLILFLKSR